MALKLLLFDMDGVLLEPKGYHTALRVSVQRIGQALGMPNLDLTEDQIAKFEALNITNEWDSLAICAAFMLVHIWQVDPSIRLNGQKPPARYNGQWLNFQEYLSSLPDGGDLPGKTTLTHLIKRYTGLTIDQIMHLRLILESCRDIYTSPTLPNHQETVLGSSTFQSHYGLEPQLDTESFLLLYDRPTMSTQQHQALLEWLGNPNHRAGIMTNRPSRTPAGYLSSPEAELGIENIGLSNLPYIGSGLLGWFASNHSDLPDHMLLKPHPVHALALMQGCLGRTSSEALTIAYSFWQTGEPTSHWDELAAANIAVFEDSAKGLISAITACQLLNKVGLAVELITLGVSRNPIKLSSLAPYATFTLEHINQLQWNKLFS
jgi:phosphoglycolate phosphatase-like HAD superfamily hydrolase